uniref:Insulin-like growth factor-binding protein 1 n=1 Tax=Loxodonta africana TaxID=9785 RepID=G3U9C7_LOXAF
PARRWRTCSKKKLALCPQVPASCQEIAGPAGCGCCSTCPLQLGAACGVNPARCGSGMRCRALPGVSRPLHALTRGQGSCVPELDYAGTPPSAEDTGSPPASIGAFNQSHVEEKTSDQPVESTLGIDAQGRVHPLERHQYLPEHQGSQDHRHQKMEAQVVSAVSSVTGWSRKIVQFEPCQRQLYKVLDRLAKAQQKAGEEIYKFYLPNCNKNGFYHSKQCETSLEGEPGLCWCVYPWSGKKIPGAPEVRGDPHCHQYFSL